MERTIFEAYNDTIIVQFISESDANAYAAANGMQVRSVEQPYEEPVEQHRIITAQDWHNLEQSLYQNQDVLSKAANSTGNGFAFMLKVLTDGKTTSASENALQLALNMLIPAMQTPFTDTEKAYINEKLQQFGFTVRIN